jgi:uncharacterized cupredoxin-like copper-binding protein
MRIFTRVLIAAAIVGGAALLASCGSSGSTSSAQRSSGSGSSRTVDVVMTDNAFQPTQLRVARGETVTLRFTNNGSVQHEALIGDAQAQAKHHADMSASTSRMEHGDMNMGGHGGMEGSENSVTVPPGMTGEITHTFDDSGTVLIGCHEPGHWDGGMRSTITVT